MTAIQSSSFIATRPHIQELAYICQLVAHKYLRGLQIQRSGWRHSPKPELSGTNGDFADAMRRVLSRKAVMHTRACFLKIH